MHKPDPDEYAHVLAAEAIGAGDPTAWFERLYAKAETGRAEVPWDRGAPHRLLVEWVKERELRGDGRQALIIGCGLGDDAEFIAGLGFVTVAFDISVSAIRTARRRYPLTTVDYVTADLLDPPAAWRQAFDLVVESLTLQSLPDPPRATAIRNVAPMVAPGGTLIVNARARDSRDDPGEGPPWPLTRAEIDAIGEGVLEPVEIEDLRDTGARRWRAEFRHPSPGNHPGG
ncbi:MAG TPA: class I SAM-dependent methyltransferase [Streptosporangiaceae bacterium]|jgi:SAM-dependent methyltransferase|nr:class I SAM-dependent methyltransferase [Streptosporangiaceae bacterium]